MLLEYNNTFLRPHYEAHADFLHEFNMVSCQFVTTLRSQCEFVKSTKSCHEFEGLIDYSYFIFCTLLRSRGSHQLLFTHFLLSFLIIVYSGLVCNITYTKLAPNCFALMRFLKLSEHTIGVILAIVSGMPEIIKGHTFSLRDEDSETIIAIILGKNFYAKTFAIGVLLIYYPIRVFPRHVLRDVISYMVCLGTFIYITTIKSHNTPLDNGIIILSIWLVYNIIVLVEEIYIAYIYKGELDPLQDPIIIIPRKMDSDEYETSNYRLIAQLIIKFNPLKLEKFHSTGKWFKIIYFISFPLRIFLDLVIPAVDYQRQHYGWSKLFNCINVVTLPVVVMIMYRFSMLTILKFSLVTVILSIIVFFTSRTDQPPKYHYMFCIFGLLGSITIAYHIIIELLAVLNLVGILIKLDRGAVGILLLAPFETLKVLVLGITIASYGYPNISYAYFLALGLIEFAGFATTLITTVLIDDIKEFPIRLGVFGQTTIIFIVMEIALSTIIVFITNFNLRRSLGWFYLVFSIIFALFIISIETHLIHPLGTDHGANQLKDDDIDWA